AGSAPPPCRRWWSCRRRWAPAGPRSRRGRPRSTRPAPPPARDRPCAGCGWTGSGPPPLARRSSAAPRMRRGWSRCRCRGGRRSCPRSCGRRRLVLALDLHLARVHAVDRALAADLIAVLVLHRHRIAEHLHLLVGHVVDGPLARDGAAGLRLVEPGVPRADHGLRLLLVV